MRVMSETELMLLLKEKVANAPSALAAKQWSEALKNVAIAVSIEAQMVSDAAPLDPKALEE